MNTRSGRRSARSASPKPKQGRPSEIRGDVELPPQPHRRIGIFTLLLAAVGVVTGCYTVHAALPPQAAGLPFDSTLATAARRLLPQGWAFFTADPRGTFLLPFRPESGGWAEAGVGPLARPANAFGFDRSPRMQNIETASLVAQSPADLWVPCAPNTALEDVDTCLDQVMQLTSSPSSVRNPAAEPTLCGLTVLVAVRSAAWPPTTSTATLIAQSAVAVDVTC